MNIQFNFEELYEAQKVYLYALGASTKLENIKRKLLKIEYEQF